MQRGASSGALVRLGGPLSFRSLWACSLGVCGLWGPIRLWVSDPSSVLCLLLDEAGLFSELRSQACGSGRGRDARAPPVDGPIAATVERGPSWPLCGSSPTQLPRASLAKGPPAPLPSLCA